MNKKMKILLFIVIVVICVARFSYLKGNSENFNKGLERTEEIVDIIKDN